MDKKLIEADSGRSSGRLRVQGWIKVGQKDG